MGYDQMMQKMTFIMYGEDIWRVHISHEEDGTPVIIIDLHYMTCREAKRAINNIIAMFKFDFKLKVIHGYNHGTAIRDMIRGELNNKRVTNMIYPHNQGQTILEIS